MSDKEDKPRRTPLFVLLNGAPGSGKDSTARALLARFGSSDGLHARVVSLAAPLKKAVEALFQLDTTYEAEEARDELQQRKPRWKDVPNPLLAGDTPRDVLITMSEEFAKHYYGEEFFCNVLYRQAVRSLNTRLWVVSDVGFPHEVDFFNRHGEVLLITIQREGTSFAGDSRSLLLDDALNMPPERLASFKRINLHNDYDFDMFKTVACRHVETWVKSRGITCS